MRLAGKIGIVTAAGSGMGRAGALRFAREGAQVAVVDVAASRVEAVIGEITAAGGTAHGIVADLTKDEDSRRIVWDTVHRFKGLDFVWNHVGHPGPAAVEGIDMQAFDLAIDLNLRTVLVTTEAAIPEMRARGAEASTAPSARSTRSCSRRGSEQRNTVGAARRLGIGRRAGTMEHRAGRRQKEPLAFRIDGGGAIHDQAVVVGAAHREEQGHRGVRAGIERRPRPDLGGEPTTLPADRGVGDVRASVGRRGHHVGARAALFHHRLQPGQGPRQRNHRAAYVLRKPVMRDSPRLISKRGCMPPSSSLNARV